MEFSKEEIMSFVGGLGVSRILAGRFRKQVLGHFPGAHLFLKASDRELAASGVHGKAMEALVRKVKEEFYLRERDDKARIAQDERVVAYQRKLKEDYEKRLEALNAEFSLSELQGIVQRALPKARFEASAAHVMLSHHPEGGRLAYDSLFDERLARTS